MKRALRNRRARRVLVGGLALFLAAAAMAAAPPLYFRIATGSTAGTYFPIGEALASIISQPPGIPDCETGGHCGVPGLIATAQAAEGSIANIRAVARGQVESGLAQGDLVHHSYYATGLLPEDAESPDLRVIANLYRESIHLVVRKGAGIGSVRDLAGKRVSLDRQASGTQVDALMILNAYGLTLPDIEAVYVGHGQAADMMLAGRLDAFFFVGGYPSAGISYLAERDVVSLLPLAGPEIDRAQKRFSFFLKDEIPAGAYPHIGAVTTLSVGAQWIVRADMDAEIVYQITRALWNPANREILDRAHPRGRMIRLENALDGVSTQLHPGAERYYLETLREVTPGVSRHRR